MLKTGRYVDELKGLNEECPNLYLNEIFNYLVSMHANLYIQFQCTQLGPCSPHIVNDCILLILMDTCDHRFCSTEVQYSRMVLILDVHVEQLRFYGQQWIVRRRAVQYRDQIWSDVNRKLLDCDII